MLPNEGLKLFRCQPAARRIFGFAVGSQAVLLDPVANGGGVATFEDPDLRQGQTLVQVVLEQGLVHARILASRSDVNRTSVRAVPRLVPVRDALREARSFAAQAGELLVVAALAGGAEAVLEHSLLELEQVQLHRLA